ncbi:MAG TPA: cyclic pyranopterin monophosphate synthase MoaC [Clostridia bacterium]|nr:cyclic pyranopterin monophosphate synthase MoaC [Clostridia bacterium]
MEKEFTHLDKKGAARMVDVSAKELTRREATAQSVVEMKPETLALIAANGIPKGDVFAVARVAGIMAAKKTSELIPMCHPLPIESVSVELVPAPPDLVRITATVACVYRTGVEMEALTAASVAALTVYDMCKAVDRGMTVRETCLLSKSGGASGEYKHTKLI